MADQTLKGRLLPFHRSAKEVRGLATRQQESGNPLKALELLRLSLEKAPEDPDTLLALGDAYAALSCWSLSNAAFFSLSLREEYAADAFYGMGRNFYALGAYRTAYDCFSLALQKQPDASFADSAIDMIDAIDDIQAEGLTLAEVTLQRRMDRVLDAMDRGNARLATRQIRRVLPISRGNSGIRSLEAFALLAAGDAQEALRAARQSHRADRTDIRALCAMASALKANGSDRAAHAYLLRAAGLIQQEDDAQLVCQTAAEAGEHAFAAELLEAAERAEPYNDDTLHMSAAAQHNSGHPEEAIRRWKLLRRIDPMDSVAAYRLRGAEEGTLPGTIPYTRQAPLSEILARLDRLRRWVHEGNDALRARWQQDDGLEAILRWGLSSPEPGIPQAMCGILTTLGDGKAQLLLLSVLCDLNASTALKHSALAALYATGAKGPFYAVMEDRLTLVHVSKAEEAQEEQAVTTDQIARQAARRLDLEDSPDPLLQSLSEGAAQSGSLPVSLRARGVVLAYCMLSGIPSPLSTTFPGHRRALRLARRLAKEASHEPLPEL